MYPAPPCRPSLPALVHCAGRIYVPAFERLYRAAGLPPIRLHDLRHTAASLALQAGVPQARVERFVNAGHFIMLDEPLEFSRKLKAFLDETEPTGLTL